MIRLLNDPYAVVILLSSGLGSLYSLSLMVNPRKYNPILYVVAWAYGILATITSLILWAYQGFWGFS